MNRKPLVDPIVAAVAGYCDAIEVPDIDAAAMVSRRHQHVFEMQRFPKAPVRIAVSAAAMSALLIVVFNMSGVVAGVARVFEAFTVAAGRTTPMTIRIVDIQRARADMPFEVIEPPPIPGAPIVTVEEMSGNASPSNGSIIFEIHGATPEREVMIVENSPVRQLATTLLTIRGSGDKPLPSLRPLEPRVSAAHAGGGLVMHASFEGKAFSPTTWITHGTRVAVMSPPGFLTDSQMRAIRRAMSR